MRHLLAADQVRFGRRRDLWILVALVPVVMALMFLSEFSRATTPPNTDFFFDPPNPAAEAQVRDQVLADFRIRLAETVPDFAFPASLRRILSDPLPPILLAIYLAVAMVAGEFEWATVRTLHLTSPRGRALAVRVGVVTGLVGLAVVGSVVLAAIIPFFLSVEGAPLQGYARPVPDLATSIAIRLLILLPFISIPVLMAILTRSISLTFLLTVLFFVVDLAITGAPFWGASPIPWAPAITVSGATARSIGDPSSPLAQVAPAWLSFGALVGWAIIPILAAIHRFRQMDLGE